SPRRDRHSQRAILKVAAPDMMRPAAPMILSTPKNVMNPPGSSSTNCPDAPSDLYDALNRTTIAVPPARYSAARIPATSPNFYGRLGSVPDAMGVRSRRGDPSR